jgi:hypothetical protein
MATLTKANINSKPIAKFNLREFIATVAEKISDSLGDVIVTVAVTGVTTAYMFNIIPAVYANTIPGLYILGMLVQLFIRIVHRFDDSYTVDELAQQVLRIEDDFNKRMDEFINSYIP